MRIRRRAGFATLSKWASEAKRAGLLQELGNYGGRLRARLQGRGQGFNGWSHGASIAMTRFQAVAAALATEGHQGHQGGSGRNIVDSTNHRRCRNGLA